MYTMRVQKRVNVMNTVMVIAAHDASSTCSFQPANYGALAHFGPFDLSTIDSIVIKNRSTHGLWRLLHRFTSVNASHQTRIMSFTFLPSLMVIRYLY